MPTPPPQLPPLKQPDTLTPSQISTLENTARSGMKALTEIMAEREKLEIANRNLTGELTRARARIEALEAGLATANTKLEHYQRLSTSLVTRLTDISGVIEAAVAEARDEARDTPASRPMKETEHERLTDLARQLAVEAPR